MKKTAVRWRCAGAAAQHLLSALRGCLDDRRGATAVMVAAMVVPLIGAIGLSVDMGRGYLVRQRLSSAIDAGALAGGRVLDTTNVQADAIQYFRANIPTTYLDTPIPDPEVTISADRQTVSVKSSVRVPTTLIRVLGIDTLPITVENRVRRQMSGGLELALVLDVTGSMATDNRIGKLRDAATSLVNILFGNQTDTQKLWISVVPYSAEVNLGTGHGDWMTLSGPSTGAYSPSTWRGCVEARPSPYDEDDSPPMVAGFKRFLYPSTKSMNNGKGGGDNDWPTITDTGTYTNSNDRTGPNLGCGFPVLPLTNVKQDLLNKIATLQPVNRGGTMANLGLQAGWFTVSPRWQGLWGSPTPKGMPLDYGSPEMSKAIVLVTDGENSWFDHSKPPTGDYTAYGRIDEGRLGTKSFSESTSEINKRMARLCEKLKNPGVLDADGKPKPGITIYTITIGQTNANTQALYRNCASQPSYYWDTPSPDQLKSVFQSIGSQLTNLRLEQ
ncbi:Flp pilus assembly protein TadG [Azospirillum brasilense]|uniref:Flp pilus assembly protein TadG n=1 Tax=Azospirillum brasilense TaxID=192 RepID=A0A560BTL9_AZOBR|nr:pilus assembly protein [Azospirillum brasilense]TWA75950.1 Flp pilus assembly protein TadG [Azospirillum brasilense]